MNWPERGVFRPLNSVPRWHITWGTGSEIIFRLLDALDANGRRGNLQLLFDHEVSGIELTGGRATALTGTSLADQRPFRATGEQLVIASGGICGGDLKKVRAHWFKGWGEPPQVLLNGAHIYGDGLLQECIILDPPAFVKSRAKVREALKGYKELNLRAMRILGPSGILVTCSCSHHIDQELFREMLIDAAWSAGRQARVLEMRSQSRDHPALLAARETQYLKCAILAIE